MSKDFRGAKR